MKYKSIDDLRNLSDNEVVDFLKRYWKTDGLTFCGIFVPNADSQANVGGLMTKVKVPGSSIILKYPLSDLGPVTFKIPANKHLDGRFYKFSCRLLRNFSNPCQLQILLNTLTEIGEEEYNYTPHELHHAKHEIVVRHEHDDHQLSPVAYRYKLLEDEQTGWGRDIQQLVGVYHKQHDGTYCLDDIRKADLTPLEKYPKTTFHVGPLPLRKPIEGLEEGQYCRFNWRFTFKVKVNLCEIEVDETKPIVFISPNEFISELETFVNAHQQGSLFPGPGMQTDVCVLIYDLLHEANRHTGTPIDVQFNLTDKYLAFQHTGRLLRADNIMSLFSQRAYEAEDEQDDVAFHCHGLREFIQSNSRTVILSNNFSVEFNNYKGVVKPQWIGKCDLPREIKISLSRNKRFNETIILPFERTDTNTQKNFKVGLHCVFEDVENIAFFTNIGKVTVKIKGGKTKTLDRKDWVVSREYQAFVTKDMREKLASLTEKHSGGQPDKPFNKKHTAIIFACRHKGKALVGEDDAPVYSLIPTTSSFGFPFLMNLDVVINKTNYALNRRSAWNKTYAEVAGRLFAKWITDLSQHAEYTSKSIYGIVPKFDECLESHPEESTFIKLFQKGFKEIILKDDHKPAQKAEAAPEKTNSHAPEKANGRAPKAVAPTAGGHLYVIDTNVFVDCPNILSRIGKDDRAILSAKVVDELDNLKYKMEDKDLRNVQKALKSINMAMDTDNVRMEMSDVSLLPRDFDRHNPDNNILSVIIRHKKESPILLTSDNGLQIKSKAMGIGVIGLKEFLAEHKVQRRQKRSTK